MDDIGRLLGRALGHGNGTHTPEDVLEMVERGDANLWPGVNSVIVTEIINQPQKKIVNFFLAAGNLKELEAMTPLVLEWAKKQGCTMATFAGRKGWEGTFLSKTDWKKSQLVIMEKQL